MAVAQVSDSKNSCSFQQIFNIWQPEIFVDTHTSNGSDYQYVITLIPTQKDKLNPILSEYMTSNMLPDLYNKMKVSGFEMTPYVNNIDESPDSGISGFLETPRFSTGYAALYYIEDYKTASRPFEGHYIHSEVKLKKLKQKLKEEKNKDPELAKSAAAQLNWLYRNSEYYEKTYMRYPVGRLSAPAKLDLK